MQNATRKKICAAVICAVVFVGLVGACLAAVLLDWGPLWEKLLCVGLLAPVIIGVLLALRQRLKEIKGGEEDAASQY